MEPTLEEKLKAVAEFSGWEEMTHTRSKNWILKNTDIDGTYAIKEASVAQMKFHTDYNWLMEAWVKLRRKYNESPNPEFYRHMEAVQGAITLSPILEAFDRLYEAIVWYNLIKK